MAASDLERLDEESIGWRIPLWVLAAMGAALIVLVFIDPVHLGMPPDGWFAVRVLMALGGIVFLWMGIGLAGQGQRVLLDAPRGRLYVEYRFLGRPKRRHTLLLDEDSVVVVSQHSLSYEGAHYATYSIDLYHPHGSVCVARRYWNESALAFGNALAQRFDIPLLDDSANRHESAYDFEPSRINRQYAALEGRTNLAPAGRISWERGEAGVVHVLIARGGLRAVGWRIVFWFLLFAALTGIFFHGSRTASVARPGLFVLGMLAALVLFFIGRAILRRIVRSEQVDVSKDRIAHECTGAAAQKLEREEIQALWALDRGVVVRSQGGRHLFIGIALTWAESELLHDVLCAAFYGREVPPVTPPGPKVASAFA